MLRSYVEIADSWGAGSYRDIPVCKWVILARERHKRDLKRIGDPDFPYYYDEEAADHAIWFFQQLKHTKGRKWRGKQFVPSDWQEWDILRPLFGWKRLDGTRRFRRFFIFVPRKNGKSTLIAAIGLYMLVADGEYGAEVYCTATKEEQAKIVWNEAKRMVRASPLLAGEVQRFAKSLFCEELESVMRPLGRDTEGHDGLDVHCGLIDEYHAHKTDEMVGVLETGIGAREQALIGIITTAGINSKCPCAEEVDFAKSLLEHRVDNEEYFVYLCEPDDPNKWDTYEECQKANPQIGLSLKWEDFEQEIKLAHQRPSKKFHFLVKRMNIWYEGAEAWIPTEKWDLGAGAIDWSLLEGKRCFGGLDMGINRDLSAFVLAFMDEKDAKVRSAEKLPRVYLLPFFWIPEEGKRRRYEEDGVDYPTWADQGFIRTTPGDTTRFDIVRRDINELAERFEIAEIAVDPAKAHQLAQELADDGFEVFKHMQTFPALNGPYEQMENLIFQGRMMHGDNPVMRWMIGNARIIHDAAERIKVAKDKSKDRVDGVVASAMAIGRLLIAPQPVRNPYNERGLAMA